MKTIVHIETTDEERQIIADKIGEKTGSRKVIGELVQKYIRRLIEEDDYGPEGYRPGPEDFSDAGRPGGDSTDQGSTGDPGLSQHDRAVTGFRPSRGDEPYLLKPRDPALRDKLSAVLDATEALDEYIWSLHNDNRIQGN